MSINNEKVHHIDSVSMMYRIFCYCYKLYSKHWEWERWIYGEDKSEMCAHHGDNDKHFDEKYLSLHQRSIFFALVSGFVWILRCSWAGNVAENPTPVYIIRKGYK